MRVWKRWSETRQNCRHPGVQRRSFSGFSRHYRQYHAARVVHYDGDNVLMRAKSLKSRWLHNSSSRAPKAPIGMAHITPPQATQS